MKKQQIVLIGSGVVLLCLIYFFGRTVPPKKQTDPVTAAAADSTAISIDQILAASRQQLTPSQQEYISRLEAGVVRGDVKDQQIRVYRQLAAFWRDSAHALLPFGYYSAEAAKLENSPKNLTFAAQFFLDGVRRQGEPAITHWMALQAKELFEKALQLDPGNDSLKVGLGSVYLFGNISTNPMEGISLIREVADRDPENMYAQFMLGLGGIYSGQLDKAAERLETVVAHQPDNLEAILMLADLYERKKDNAKAIRWYQAGKKKISNPAIVQEIDQRINNLKK
ncbi:MAG: tetratricopeptide repeat protein [Candidatus Pseudobacter hemicellulosilyticus]|uniref:Tetratricopeptide repeat protein n=1 Tax=Candidatus Pseudobacter hemicellulosilyticus TaxID=3121375 RepID=A0AAJ5WX78_9BACT|nr:MAG: tetratricopeptide repeat protein [Pseudobacter sp.]